MCWSVECRIQMEKMSAIQFRNFRSKSKKSAIVCDDVGQISQNPLSAKNGPRLGPSADLDRICFYNSLKMTFSKIREIFKLLRFRQIGLLYLN